MQRILTLILAFVVATLTVSGAQVAPAVVQYAGALTGVGLTQPINCQGRPTASIVFSGAGLTFSATARSSSDNGASWVTMTAIGTVSSTGTYTGNMLAQSNGGTTLFDVDVTALSGGTLSYVETCSSAVGVPTPSANQTVVQTSGANLHTNVDSLPSLPAGSNLIGAIQSELYGYTGSAWATAKIDASGYLYGDLAACGTSFLACDTSLPAGSNIIGAVTQSGTWNVGQSGTWTVQPGNTANTTPWLESLSGGLGSAPGTPLYTSGGATVTFPYSYTYGQPSTAASYIGIGGSDGGTHFNVVTVDGGGRLYIDQCIIVTCATSPGDSTSNSNTLAFSLDFLMGFNGTTWDRLRDDTNKYLYVNLGACAFAGLACDTSLPTGANTIGAVNQGTSPWVTSCSAVNCIVQSELYGYNGTSWATLNETGNALDSSLQSCGASFLACDTALPTGANVIGAVTQSGAPWSVNCVTYPCGLPTPIPTLAPQTQGATPAPIAAATAAPANALAVGYGSSGLNPAIYGETNVPLAITAAATTQIVALVAGKRIFVNGYHFTVSTTDNVNFVYGTGTNCGTGTTYLTGSASAAEEFSGPGGGEVIPNSSVPVWTVPAGNALCIVTSAAAVLAGSMTIAQM